MAGDEDESVQGLRAAFAERVARAEEREVQEMLGVIMALADALPMQQRTHRWRSLTYCILDAVWSIGARYEEVVVPLVRRVAQEHAPEGDPLTDAKSPLPPDPAPLPAFLGRFDEAALLSVTNRQRTSTRNGRPKAAVALAHAKLFDAHGLRTLTDAESLLLDKTRFEHLDAALRVLPGEGSAGIRRGYLWMLVGRDDLVKPDRMVTRALRHHGVRVSPREAGALLRAAAVKSQAGPSAFTAWELDHALWQEGRRLAARSQSLGGRGTKRRLELDEVPFFARGTREG